MGNMGIDSSNQKTWQRLVAALSLGLRRQLFLAVCDDLGLQNRLASKLQSEQGQDFSLVSLHLNFDDPNPMAQIAQWLVENEGVRAMPHFQITGVERLTRQPPNIQRLFIRRLQVVEKSLPGLESCLVLWLPRPWFNLIQKSVPEFWQWHTGLFEFEGEPTPQPPANSQPENSPEEATPVDRPTPALTNAYLNLAQQYRDRLAQGEVTEENLIIAIQAYEQAMAGLEPESLQFVEVLNDLGNLYLMRSRLNAHTPALAKQQLEQCLKLYYQALEKFSPDQAADTYAMIQSNLGAAYGDLARYVETVNPEDAPLQKSIQAYQQALLYRPKDRDPLKYAATQNNLGTTYWHLAQQTGTKDLAANYLHSAIAAYAEALTQYYNQGDALNWAMIQNNLGTAYWNLAQYEQPDAWLQLAISAYQDALKYRRRDTLPAACAATQNNLATAFWHLAERCRNQPETRLAYLQKAIAIYESAIQLADKLAAQQPPTPVSFDVLATRNNLGLAYYQIATENLLALDSKQKSRYLELSLQQHLLALQSLPPQTDSYKSAFNSVLKTVRSFYRECGSVGQNHALAMIPGKFLPEILPKL